jgi:hypothetical protein
VAQHDNWRLRNSVIQWNAIISYNKHKGVLAVKQHVNIIKMCGRVELQLLLFWAASVKKHHWLGSRYQRYNTWNWTPAIEYKRMTVIRT